MRQRGVIQLYLVAGIAALLAIGGAYAWGRHDGKTIEKAAWEKRDNDALRQANADIDAAHRKNRETERAGAERLAQVSAEYQKELSDVRTKTRERVAAVSAGALRLRDPAASNQACANRTAEAGAPAGGRDGAAPGGLLSEAASVFLVGEAGRADEIALQLRACQDVIRADRK